MRRKQHRGAAWIISSLGILVFLFFILLQPSHKPTEFSATSLYIDAQALSALCAEGSMLASEIAAGETTTSYVKSYAEDLEKTAKKTLKKLQQATSKKSALTSTLEQTKTDGEKTDMLLRELATATPQNADAIREQLIAMKVDTARLVAQIQSYE